MGVSGGSSTMDAIQLSKWLDCYKNKNVLKNWIDSGELLWEIYCAKLNEEPNGKKKMKNLFRNEELYSVYGKDEWMFRR
ncbi:hypothetical protein TNCV_248101 [Trichonephila clavipes]|nr:hypothetical protein TNCV_248101 [Trichonephila clavipes]